jgi:ribosomal-protein-alanine N-acetyltransferase
MSKQVVTTIRKVQASDYETLASFFEANNIPEVIRHFHPFPLNAQTAYKIACNEHLDRYYIAIRDTRIVGLCMLRGWDDGFGIPSFGVCVDHNFQRLGLGRQLAEFAIGEAIRLACPSVRLSVYANNIRAANLYMNLGFEEISRESILLEGEHETKIIMVKDLKC